MSLAGSTTFSPSPPTVGRVASSLREWKAVWTPPGVAGVLQNASAAANKSSTASKKRTTKKPGAMAKTATKPTTKPSRKSR